MRCASCGREDPPARCSRCLSAWFCGPECQRAAWREHRPLCKLSDSKAGQAEGERSFLWGEASDTLLHAVPWKVSEKPLERVEALTRSQQHLDALGAALTARLARFGHEAEASDAALRQAAEALWKRCQWEPHPKEKHDYSLLHAIPEGCAEVIHQDPPPTSSLPPQTGPVPPRYEPQLCGSSCPVVDAEGGFGPEVRRQLAAYFNPKAPRPCIIKNLPIFQQAVEKWDVAYLAQHMGDQLYHTFASSQEERRFAYSFDCRNEGGYEPARIAEACKMTFKDFVAKQKAQDGRAYYLQTPVLRYEDNVITSAKFDKALEADLHTMDRTLVNQLAAIGKFGPLSRNQLFVSFRDFLTAVHYDQQHNLYLQLRGTKRFLLFDVACAPALYPYPVHHSLDRKARVDLEHLDATWPKAQALAGRGVEANLEPGDLLFLPMSWFHHVHSLAEENVSLNFWFYDSGFLFEPSKVEWPLTQISLLELSRHVEYFVAEQLGPAAVGAFVGWWLDGQMGPGDPVLGERWRLVRNYLLRQLLRLPRTAARFVVAALDPRRWQGLARQSASPQASLGLTDEHKVSELLKDLKELSLGVFHSRMPAWAYRNLGRAIQTMQRHKLRFFLECAEEVLCLLRDHTNWGSGVATAPELFAVSEARKAPAALLRTLHELCDLAEARYVRVTVVDNGLFANWLQVLDAAYFAEVPVDVDWVRTQQQREFNYGRVGEDVFHGLFERIPLSDATQPRFDVTHRFNFLLVNVFRGHFLRGPQAPRRRLAYAAAAKSLRPRAEVLAQRDRLLARRKETEPLIGVHKRVDNPGTARMQLEQRMLSTQAYLQAARKLVEEYSDGRPLVLLASDDEAAVETFRQAFQDRLIFAGDVKRCQGGVNEQKLPLEVHGQQTALALSDARDCLVDALLLSSCDAMVHADSNVTIAAGIMNPYMPAFHVRDLAPSAPEAGEWQGYKPCRLPF